MLPDTVSHAWEKLVRKAGLQGIRMHDARHTHASLMLAQGVHPKVVSERLGHATIAITLDTYSHCTPSLQEAAALRFEEGLFVSPEGAPASYGENGDVSKMLAKSPVQIVAGVGFEPTTKGL